MVSLRLVLSGLNFKKIVPIIKNQAVNLQTNGIMKSECVYQFLVVLMLILPVSIFSQQQIPLFAQKTPHITPSQNFKLRVNENNGDTSLPVINKAVPVRFILNPLPIRIEGIEVINANFTIQNLPFFCKKEFLFERSTSVPLRVRLGSLDYVNKLEGKENHIVPGN